MDDGFTRSSASASYTTPMPTVGQILAEARPRLAATSFGAPTREALLLLGHVLGLSEARVIAREDAEVPPAAERRFRALLERRLAGEPVAYLTGVREFWGRPFHVDPRVLIPRPETEHVVEAALAERLPASPWILDVGTGSGCLAVTLALEVPGSRVVATDLAPGALAVAAGNARRLGAADRVSFVRTDLAAGLDLSRFDLVVSNPPYVDRSEIPEISPEVCNFEPLLALFPPGAGDSILARLFAQCAGLRSGVALAVEIGRGQMDAARRHAEAAGLDLAEVREDYSAIPRVLVLRRH
ncbi:MAG TPA: peptide chain release factor N(5)-glutamine methyltransferase [Thermoanaerobaculia bacterium]|jgi:release factor glutamine methyltransferase